ncbi:MAG: ABC transporter permease [Candidatus Flexifilum sp.]
MIARILNIVWKDLYITYTDRNLLVIMLATPLALAVIISLAFSSFFNAGGGVPIRDIPVAIVNLDEGVEVNGQRINQGDTYVRLLVPPADASADALAANPLFQLTEARTVATAEAARALVDSGAVNAAIIIPADFSASLTITGTRTELVPTQVEVYASGAAAFSGGIIRTVVSAISSTLATGSISIAATIDALVDRAASDPAFGLAFGAAALTGAFNPDFSAAFDPDANPVRVEQQTVAGERAAFNPLVFFGAGQAVFFMLFTAMGSAASLLEEKREGTLQRMVISPTPRSLILIAVLVNCVMQVVLLFLALTLVGALITGQLTPIWGTNVLAILATIGAVALAASGLAALVMSLVRSAETGNIIGDVIAMFMGLFGGVFFNIQAIPALAPISRLTIVYWGTDAFTRLSANQTDIGFNLIVLAGMGLILFGAGLAVFNRRLSF